MEIVEAETGMPEPCGDMEVAVASSSTEVILDPSKLRHRVCWP